MNRLEIRPNHRNEIRHRNHRRQRQMIGLNDVTPRDGEQQEKKFDVMPVTDRIAVFDQLVATGISRIEIGHLGNLHDQDYARALVPHIQSRSRAGDTRYDAVELQVLFGTHVGKLEEGVEALGDFAKDRVVIHVYDRSTENLRKLASEPYSTRESAQRVINTSLEAFDKGFTRFSVSGEGSVDPDLSLKEATDQFYLPIVNALHDAGATAINVNLANTFGLSTDEVGDWSKKGLKKFNARIKQQFPGTTTSIHVHNDHRSAVENSLDALEGGFDYVEGTIIGMGERAGNVALVDVMVRLLEKGRQTVEAQERNVQKGRLARIFGKIKLQRNSIWSNRYMDPNLMDNLGNWHESASKVGEIYETSNRFERTSLGDSDAYSAGSGPHAQANKAALIDPVRNPLWRNYARIALEHSMLGRPEATEVIEVNRERLRRISLLTHAAGGSSRDMQGDEVIECSEEVRQQAISIANDHKEKIVYTISNTPKGPKNATDF